MAITTCQKCNVLAGTLYYESGNWYCGPCRPYDESNVPYFKEMGTANPFDPKGSTAHVNDIKDRRWHPTEKRQFYWSKEKTKTYFFPKG